MSLRRVSPVIALALAAASAVARVPQGEKPITAVRGIVSAVEVKATGKRIVAKGNQSLTAPVVVRIGSSTSEADGSIKYRVEFIGAVVGDFDLRQYLERQDGTAVDLPPVMIHVVSQLSPDPGTDLFSTAEAPLLSSSNYRLGMLGLGAVWLGIPTAYLIVRRLRRKPEEPPPVVIPPPTFAEQLRPLVESAMSGSLSVAERGRLELLLYLYWRGRRGLEGRQAEVVSRLRNDTEAGALLCSVERWLHAERTAPERAEGEVAALLEPYRHAPAVVETAGVPA